MDQLIDYLRRRVEQTNCEGVWWFFEYKDLDLRRWAWERIFLEMLQRSAIRSRDWRNLWWLHDRLMASWGRNKWHPCRRRHRGLLWALIALQVQKSRDLKPTVLPKRKPLAISQDPAGVFIMYQCSCDISGD